jgi:spore coat protein U-like protein
MAEILRGDDMELNQVLGVAASAKSALAEIANKVSCEFLVATDNLKDWYGYHIGNGTKQVSASSAKHPGVVEYKSSAAVGSGYMYYTEQLAILLGGGEKTTIVFKTAATIAGVTRRMGFLDTSLTAATDGVYCKIADGVITGQTASNSTVSTTATNYTLSAETWYRLVIQLNEDATAATFTLYADDSDTVLWTDALSTNIPTEAGRNLAQQDVCYFTNPDETITSIGYIDYMDIVLPNARRV